MILYESLSLNELLIPDTNNLVFFCILFNMYIKCGSFSVILDKVEPKPLFMIIGRDTPIDQNSHKWHSSYKVFYSKLVVSWSSVTTLFLENIRPRLKFYRKIFERKCHYFYRSFHFIFKRKSWTVSRRNKIFHTVCLF